MAIKASTGIRYSEAKRQKIVDLIAKGKSFRWVREKYGTAAGTIKRWDAYKHLNKKMKSIKKK
jgi:hypothetical protein